VSAPLLELAGVGVNFGKATVLRGIDLELGEGEFVAIIGFSGAGKSTLLNVCAGLVQPSAGSALFRSRPITGAELDRGVVFQNYSLLPWLSVVDNVALAVGARSPALSRKARRDRALDFVRLVGLDHAATRRPHELSGGMRQRVSVARALATEPALLLLDEPFGALDALTRGTLQDELARIWERTRKSVLLVTNDVDEALLLADRVLLLGPGPGATLAASFEVSLARPRRAQHLNANADYKRLRNSIVRRLLELRSAPGEGPARSPHPLPRLLRPHHAA
jgi:nitrate/nitrite transport system ATP-binding protein